MKFVKEILSTKTVQVALWVAISGVLTAVLTTLLSRPDLAAYYGVINVLLVLLKEVSKK